MASATVFTGMILPIQHFSVDDGPGIRTTVFLKGCPLRCDWCHNPESWHRGKELLYHAAQCRSCGICASVCPGQVHHFPDHRLERERCIRCGQCAAACPHEALELAGQQVSVEEILPELLLDQVFYRRSGGGITVSGGEPLAQPEFTAALLRACKEEGLHTCIETCGYGDPEALRRLLPLTDLFLFDYKLTDDLRHQACTGVSNALILQNLDLLCCQGAAVILRCPMIPGVNLEPAHYDGIAALARRYPAIEEIHLEPYHPLGISKAQALGRQAAYSRAAFLEKQELENAADHIRRQVAIPIKIL